SEYECLTTALMLRAPAEKLVKSLNLKAFKLSEKQYKLAVDLSDILECLQAPTKLFLRRDGSRPLISEVIPAMEDLREQLETASKDIDLPDVCCVAAHAGWLVLDKYYNIVSECENLTIFLAVMCPDRKLKWFEERGRSATQLQRIRERVVTRFQETF
ncbi:hypothetical protein BT96DRAFT_757860, partial [Gymnopus androsaceus JB14]